MFYETERIVSKQLKYEKTKAYTTISELESKGLSTKDMIGAINILLEDDNTELRVAVLKKAKAILEARKEITDEETMHGHADTGPNNDICPIISNTQRHK